MELKEIPKPKRSIIDTILLKRSTKITPHPGDDNNVNGSSAANAAAAAPSRLHPSSSTSIASVTHTNPFQCSNSTNSTPVKRLYKASRLQKLWHCHGSSLSLASNHSAPSNFLRKTSENVKRKIRNTVDRHSHPIGCSDTQSGDANQYCAYCTENDNNNNDNNNSSSKDQSEFLTVHDNVSHPWHTDCASMARSISKEQFIDSIPNGKSALSKSQEQIIVNDIDEGVIADWGKQRSPTSKSHDGNFLSNRTEPTYPYEHSIAMSACRSRLREKLLPPGFNLAECSTSHSAVATTDSSTITEHPKHSRSFSCDTLPNAKRSGRTESLAKHSLMAAQLINLIPTEVARER